MAQKPTRDSEGRDPHEAAGPATDPTDGGANRADGENTEITVRDGAEAEAEGRRTGNRMSRITDSEAFSLIVEFFSMSRTTVALLVAFILTLVLYMLVRQDPVVAFSSPPRGGPTQVTTSEEPVAPASEPSSVPSTYTTVPSTTDAMTAPDSSPTGTAVTEVPTSSGQSGGDLREGQGARQTQPTSQQAQPTSQQAPAGQQAPRAETTQVPVT